MIGKEIAVLLAHPDYILGPRRLVPDLGDDAYGPVVHRANAQPVTSFSLGEDVIDTVPVFVDVMPSKLTGDMPDDDALEECVAVLPQTGPRGERLFGTRGIGRAIQTVTVEVRGFNPRKVNDRRFGQSAYDVAETRARRASHIIACAMTAQVLREWPDDTDTAFEQLDDGARVTLGEIDILPVYLDRHDENQRPVYAFDATIVRWA